MNESQKYKYVYIAWISLAESSLRTKSTSVAEFLLRTKGTTARKWRPIKEKVKNQFDKIDGYEDIIDLAKSHEVFIKCFPPSLFNEGREPGPGDQDNALASLSLSLTDDQKKKLRKLNQKAFVDIIASIVNDKFSKLPKRNRVDQLKKVYEIELNDRLDKVTSKLEKSKRLKDIEQYKKEISQLESLTIIDEKLFQLDFPELFDKWLTVKGPHSYSRKNDKSPREFVSLSIPETSQGLSGHIYGGRAMRLDELLPELKLESFNNEIPPYVERETDKELRSKIEEIRMNNDLHGLVVVCGEPKSGKTRSVFEALQKECPNIPVWWAQPYPASISIFSENLIERNRQNPNTPLVIVLDDLSSFDAIDDGLTLQQLNLLRSKALLVVIVHKKIMGDWGDDLENKILDKNRDSLQGIGRTLYKEIKKETVSQKAKLNDDEMQDAQLYLNKLPRDLEIEKINTRRYPEFLAAVPLLRKKIQNIYHEGTDKAAHKIALIHALTDATIMYPSGINETQLEQLTRWELEILDENYRWDPDMYNKAIEWADAKVGNSTNKTHVIRVQFPRSTELYKLYDPLVQEQQEKLFQNRGPDIFDFLVKHLDEVGHDVAASIARSSQVNSATMVIWMIRAALLGDKEALLWIRLNSFRIHKVSAAESMFSLDYLVPSITWTAYNASSTVRLQFRAPLKFVPQERWASIIWGERLASVERLLHLLEPFESQYVESIEMFVTCFELIREVRDKAAQTEWLKEKYDAGNIHAGIKYLGIADTFSGKDGDFKNPILRDFANRHQNELVNMLSGNILGHLLLSKDIESALSSLETYLFLIKQISNTVIMNSKYETKTDYSDDWMWGRTLASINDLSDSQRYDFIAKSLALLKNHKMSVKSQTEIRHFYLLLLIAGGQADEALSFVDETSSDDFNGESIVTLSQLLERDGKHDDSFRLLKSYFNKDGWQLESNYKVLVQMGMIANTPAEKHNYSKLIGEIEWNNSSELERFIRGFWWREIRGERKKAVELLMAHPLYEKFKDRIGPLDSNNIESLEQWLHALCSAYKENADIRDYFTLVEFGSEESKRYAQKIREKIINEITSPASVGDLLVRASHRPFWKACEEDKRAKKRMEEILNILDEVEGQYTEIEYARIYAYDALGETDKAMQCLSKAIALNSPYALLLAWWLEKHGLSLTDNGSEYYLEKAVKVGSLEALICMADKLLETDEADTIENHIKACVHHYLNPI